MGTTYQDAGVHIEKGYEVVKRIQSIAAKTFTKGVLGGLGSFGAMFELPKGYTEPVLVSGTDGVGTKLRIAIEMNQHNTIGMDCVAMCVNDLLCQGAKPLYFLDYIAMGQLEPDVVVKVIEGVGQGCQLAGCALIGGETAEMPGFYGTNEYDMAGFAVGIVEKSKIINGRTIQAGDICIGIESSGLHSNGYSLARKVCESRMTNGWHTPIESHDRTLGEMLLTPTKIYVSLVQPLLDQYEIKGMAHITGGGWYENIPRMFSNDDLQAQVQRVDTTNTEIFKLLQQWGNIETEEMYRTFNMGIGMVLVVAKENTATILEHIGVCGEKGHIIGIIAPRNKGEAAIRFV